MRYLWREHRLPVEGSAAIGVGALLAGRIDVAGAPVCIVTGMNVDDETLTRVLGHDDASRVRA
jgi:threonine dehydratase